LHRARHPASVLLDDRARRAADRARLRVEEARRLDLLLERAGRRVGERLRAREPAEETRRHHVDPRIGALRGQDRRHEKLERRLETSDLPGHLLPWDYFTEKPEDSGLARVATRVAAIRKASPNVLLLDGGDTIQGTPIEYLHAKDPASGPDPTITAMNAVAYD